MKKLVLLILPIILLGSGCSQTPTRTTARSTPKVVVSEKPPSQPPLEPTKVVYLTLDADMSPSMEHKLHSSNPPQWYDEQLISYLIDNKVPATFFVSGLFAEVYPNLIKRLNATGNYTFENHSYDESGFTPHCYWLHPLLTDKEKTDQINQTQKILADLTGRPPIYFRYPGLCHSDADNKLVTNMGFKINEGDIVASDPFNPDKAKIEQNVYRQLKNNGIIIMHVGGPNAPKSFAVLKDIIPVLTKLGYTIKHL